MKKNRKKKNKNEFIASLIIGLVMQTLIILLSWNSMASIKWDKVSALVQSIETSSYTTESKSGTRIKYNYKVNVVFAFNGETFHTYYMAGSKPSFTDDKLTIPIKVNPKNPTIVKYGEFHIGVFVIISILPLILILNGLYQFYRTLKRKYF